MPGTSWWYAGSSLIAQPLATPHSLSIPPKLEGWVTHLLKETEGLVTVDAYGPVAEGWRPAPRRADDVEAPLVLQSHDRLVLRPLWHSGVRWAPLATDALLAAACPQDFAPVELTTAMRASPAVAPGPIRPACPEDEAWIAAIWRESGSMLGPFGVTWHRFWHNTPTAAERFICLPELAFAHYRQRRDGSVTLYEIAVAHRAKRQGLARTLMEYMSEHGTRTMQLKTDADVPESNAFYQALGFTLQARTATKSGKKYVHQYQRPCVSV
jgi:ribosomal protein S18 acetylase RimI-like enzyme